MKGDFMKMKVTVLAALSALALTACDELEGTISVNDSLKVVNKKGQTVSIPKGNYQSKFDYDSGKRRLKIKIKDVGKDDQKLEMNLPDGVEIPTYEGDFTVMGYQVGQSFDLEGRVQTDTDVSSPTRT